MLQFVRPERRWIHRRQRLKRNVRNDGHGRHGRRDHRADDERRQLTDDLRQLLHDDVLQDDGAGAGDCLAGGVLQVGREDTRRHQSREASGRQILINFITLNFSPPPRFFTDVTSYNVDRLSVEEAKEVFEDAPMVSKPGLKGLMSPQDSWVDYLLWVEKLAGFRKPIMANFLS